MSPSTDPKHQEPRGVCLLDKSQGPTSHDIVAQVRRRLQTRAVGHAGTLDPMATGLLVVTVGEAGKLVPYLTGSDKTYTTTLVLGTSTETLDAYGLERTHALVSIQVREALEQVAKTGEEAGLASALQAERARTEQTPPIYSAIHIDGERAYAQARRGGTPVLPPRSVAVRHLVCTGAGLEPEPWITLTLTVSKGYYVRALARDLAAHLGTVGHLTALRRLRAGPFSVEQAVSLEGEAELPLLSLEEVVRHVLPCVQVSHTASLAIAHGRPVHHEALVPGDTPQAWLDPHGRLLAIGQTISPGLGRVLRGISTE